MSGPFNSKRNFGWGKSLKGAVRLAYRTCSDPDRFSSEKRFMENVTPFFEWAKDNGIGDLSREDPQWTLEEYGWHKREQVQEGEVAVGTAQNHLSAANQVFMLLSGSSRYWISPSEYSGPRNYARTEPPDGMAHAVIESLIGELVAEGLPRVAAGVALARYGGLRREEFCLANLHRWRREAPSGRISVVDGTKGGIVPGRLVPVTERLRGALDFALSVKPKGSHNLLLPEEQYKNFKLGEVQRARSILKRLGVDGYHELRAAYACDRYEQMTGSPAPVMTGGRRTAEKEVDRWAREQISIELGHRRIQITTSYYGGRRERFTARFIGGRRA